MCNPTSTWIKAAALVLERPHRWLRTVAAALALVVCSAAPAWGGYAVSVPRTGPYIIKDTHDDPNTSITCTEEDLLYKDTDGPSGNGEDTFWQCLERGRKGNALWGKIAPDRVEVLREDDGDGNLRDELLDYLRSNYAEGASAEVRVPAPPPGQYDLKGTQVGQNLPVIRWCASQTLGDSTTPMSCDQAAAGDQVARLVFDEGWCDASLDVGFADGAVVNGGGVEDISVFRFGDAAADGAQESGYARVRTEDCLNIRNQEGDQSSSAVGLTLRTFVLDGAQGSLSVRVAGDATAQGQILTENHVAQVAGMGDPLRFAANTAAIGSGWQPSPFRFTGILGGVVLDGDQWASQAPAFGDGTSAASCAWGSLKTDDACRGITVAPGFVSTSGFGFRGSGGRFLGTAGGVGMSPHPSCPTPATANVFAGKSIADTPSVFPVKNTNLGGGAGSRCTGAASVPYVINGYVENRSATVDPEQNVVVANGNNGRLRIGANFAWRGPGSHDLPFATCHGGSQSDGGAGVRGPIRATYGEDWTVSLASAASSPINATGECLAWDGSGLVACGSASAIRTAGKDYVLGEVTVRAVGNPGTDQSCEVEALVDGNDAGGETGASDCASYGSATGLLYGHSGLINEDTDTTLRAIGDQATYGPVDRVDTGTELQVRVRDVDAEFPDGCEDGTACVCQPAPFEVRLHMIPVHGP